MNEDLSIDYDIWDLVNEFSPFIAACLWCGIDPNKESRNQNLLNKVIKMHEILLTAARERKLTCPWPQGVPCLPSRCKDAYDTYRHLSRELIFDRAGLKIYAENIGQKPPFLYPEMRTSTSPAKPTLKSMPPSRNEEVKKDNPQAFKHSEDFRSVTLGNNKFSLTPRQAQIVEILYNAYLNGTPEIGKDYILEKLGSPSSRLRDSFKNSNVWGTLIVKGKKQGTYRLNI